MYRWAVYFLKEWNVDCSHLYGFNMDEWVRREGNTLEQTNQGAFQNAMEEAFMARRLDGSCVPKEILLPKIIFLHIRKKLQK